jgi:hypothetical protein
METIDTAVDQEQAIAVRQLDATSHLPPQNGQLMPERSVLGFKSAASEALGIQPAKIGK